MEEQVRMALERQNPWWFGKMPETGIPRLKYYPELQRHLHTPEMLLILGARRTGKSTLLFQLIASLEVDPASILFVNFDEPVFQSKADDPSFLGTLIDEHIHRHERLKRFSVFIDEVQQYAPWAQALKTIHDTNQNIKLVLTGSTSALVQSAASTRLSGRYLITTVRPLSFPEFLAFTGFAESPLAKKRQLALDYLRFGGFPRVVLERDEAIKQEILKNYFQAIYLKDIIYPHRLRNNKDVFELLYFILSNAGKPFSYTTIAKTLGVAVDTIKEYITYAEESYLVHSVLKYDASVRKQLANPRKLYCADTGLMNAVSFRFSEDQGRVMENLVLTTLVRQHREIYYHKGDYECDFMLREGRKIIRAIQVTANLNDEAVKKRELQGLVEAMDAHHLHQGIIITESEMGKEEKGGKMINIIPLSTWLETA